MAHSEPDTDSNSHADPIANSSTIPAKSSQPMRVVCLSLLVLLSGCTTFYHNGQKVFSTSANVTGLVITKDGDMSAQKIDSSTAISTAGASAMGVIMSLRATP